MRLPRPDFDRFYIPLPSYPPPDPPLMITLLLVGFMPPLILSVTLFEYFLRPSNFSYFPPLLSSLFVLPLFFILASKFAPLALMRCFGFLTSSPFIRSVCLLEKLFIIERPSLASLPDATSFVF